MTALQLVNSVLRRLRETEVTDFTASYTKLILDLLNETKREVEDAWDWSALRSTLTVNTDTINRSYSITGAGQRYRFIKRPGTDNVSAYNTTNKSWLSLVDNNKILEQVQIGTTTPAPPSEFAITGQDASLDPIITFGPIPDAVSVLKFNMVIPQAELSAVGDILTVPWYPVVQGTWAKSISERGEDGGQNTIEQYNMYMNSLSDAIAQDAARLGETTWVSV